MQQVLQGAQGTNGTIGSDGAQGAVGAQGAAGTGTGAQGAAGATGAQGAAGAKAHLLIDQNITTLLVVDKQRSQQHTNASDVDVFMNGVRLTPAEYTASVELLSLLLVVLLLVILLIFLHLLLLVLLVHRVPKVIRAMHLTGQSLTSQQLLVRLRSHHLVDIQMVMTLMYL